MKLITPKIFLLFFLPLCLFLSFNKHSKDKTNSYHGVIWADAGGYYVYEPMWFIYGNSPAAFPDSVEANTGYGFHLDSLQNKIITKYPSGIAIMQSPFFLFSHLLAKPLGFKADGFSKIYSFGLYFAGIIYCCFGLFLLSSFLKRHFSALVSVLCPLAFLVATNLFYYAIDAPGMSHIYSFFLFSCIIYLTPALVKRASWLRLFLFFICVVLIALCRPTNIIIALFPLFYGIGNKHDFYSRVSYFFSRKRSILLAFLPASLLALPQLYYWYNTFGSALAYSYGNEGFTSWKSPKLLEVWFSFKNGLFIYTPLIILSLVGIVLMFKKQVERKWEAGFLALLFLLVSYLFASWWCWWFGCAYGARSFVEYYALLMMPFAFISDYMLKNKAYRFIWLIFVAFCCYLNMDIEYYYDGCFYGETWDFGAYLKLLDS